jgi:NAD(P)H-dependent nitrite reductase small subunit
VRDPERKKAFRHFANSEASGETLPFVRERGQKRPHDWPDPTPSDPLPVAAEAAAWVRMAAARDVPRDGGVTVDHDGVQIAIFNFASRGAWYATEAVCPHRKDAVLGRGLLGTQDGTAKVACPMHKKTFALETGEGLSDPRYRVATFPVEVRDGEVWVKVPPAAALRRAFICPAATAQL